MSSPAYDVLIVEDDSDLRDMMAELLGLEGFTAVTTANGREALASLQTTGHPGVILLDLMMPVMDGYEFLHTQRQDPRFAAIPVVVLSALDPSRSASTHVNSCNSGSVSAAMAPLSTKHSPQQHL